MMKRTKRTAARATLVTWTLSLAIAAPAAGEGSGPAGHAGIAGHPDLHSGASVGTEPVMRVPVALATAASTAGECPPQLSCGYGCTAELRSWFCTVTFSWEGGIEIGGAQLGPTLAVECHLCECWYIMPGPNGSLFQRTLDFGCGASFEGLEHQ